MKIWICWIAMGAVLICCKSKEKTVRPGFGYIPVQPVETIVQETVKDTLVIDETTVPVKKEKVELTDGTELLRYCVIVGSFIYEQNAINLRVNLKKQGFSGCSIMRNSEGMYRVSAACDDTHADAVRELDHIRCAYPQYRDAWLLEVKKD